MRMKSTGVLITVRHINTWLKIEIVPTHQEYTIDNTQTWFKGNGLVF